MTTKAHFDVLVIGNPSVDIVFSGMPHWPVPGKEFYVANFGISAGASFNTAATLSRLGLRVALFCELGNDFFSRFILEEVERAGISRELVQVHERPLYSVSVCLAHDGERGFISYTNLPGGIGGQVSSGEVGPDATTGEDVSAAGQESQRMLLDYDFDAVFMYVHPEIHPLLDILTDKRAKIFFDTGWHPEILRDPRLPAVLRRGYAVLPNQIEAECMTGAQSAEEAARRLAAFLPVAVVKVGERGVLACQDGELISVQAFPIQKVVDTTGAGDAFNAGFIYGTLKGYPLAEALRCGTICGSLSTTAITGTAAVPTAQELEQLRLEHAR